MIAHLKQIAKNVHQTNSIITFDETKPETNKITIILPIPIKRETLQKLFINNHHDVT